MAIDALPITVISRDQDQESLGVPGFFRREVFTLPEYQYKLLLFFMAASYARLCSFSSPMPYPHLSKDSAARFFKFKTSF